jgi:hypothetical protein
MQMTGNHCYNRLPQCSLQSGSATLSFNRGVVICAAILASLDGTNLPRLESPPFHITWPILLANLQLAN